MNNFRIIWISDLHFDDICYNEESHLYNLALKLKNKVLDLIRDNSKIRIYVIISGDLAFSGKELEYDKLELFLNDTFDNTLDINFITIPGNHDVNWNSYLDIYLNGYFNNNKPKEFLESLFLKKKNKVEQFKLHQLFKNYSRFFRNYILQKNKAPIEYSNNYKDYGLYGFVIDNECKIIFILVNSSWFSRGHSIKNFLQTIKLKEPFVNDDIFDIAEITQESGKLWTGYNDTTDEFKNYSKELKNLLCSEKFHSYLKIMISHHPIEWLDPTELHNYSKPTYGTFLSEVIKKSDLLLTGHIHPSPISLKEKLIDLDIHHFRGMMLINHLNETSKKEDKLDERYPCNGFASLTMSENRLEIKIEYFFIDYSKYTDLRIISLPDINEISSIYEENIKIPIVYKLKSISQVNEANWQPNLLISYIFKSNYNFSTLLENSLLKIILVEQKNCLIIHLYKNSFSETTIETIITKQIIAILNKNKTPYLIEFIYIVCSEESILSEFIPENSLKYLNQLVYKLLDNFKICNNKKIIIQLSNVKMTSLLLNSSHYNDIQIHY